MASDFLPPVSAKLDADISGFKHGMSEAKGELSAVEKTGSGSFSKLAVGVGGAMVAGGAAVVAFATGAVDKFGKVAGEVGKLERLTGDSAESMSKLRFEAEETGVSYETLTKGIVKLSKGVDGGNKAFAENNIATTDAQGKLLSMNDIVANTAEVFKNMPNGIEKNALAVKLFGKSGVDMIPMLNKGKEGLADLAKEADKFGLVIGQKDVDAAKKNVIAHREMHAAWEGAQVQVGKLLMPVLASFSAFMAGELPKAIAVVKKVINGLQPTFQAISEWIAVLTEWWKAHWDEISAAVQNVIGYISGFISTSLAVIEAFWRTFGDNVTSFLQSWIDGLVGIVKGLFDAIVGVFDLFRDLFTGKWGKLWGDVKDIFTGIWDAVKAYVMAVLGQIEAILSAAWTVIKGAVSAAWEGIKSVISAVLDGIVGFVSGLPGRALNALSSLGSSLATLGGAAIHALWDAFGAAWDAGFSFVTGIPGKILGALGSIGSDLATAFGKIPGAVWSAFKSAWNTVADIASFHIPQVTIPMPPGIPDIHFGGGTIALLPHLARGGTATESGLAVVGENGAEIVALNRGDTVYPHGTRPAADGQSGNTFIYEAHGITDHQELASDLNREMQWMWKVAA